MVQDLTRLEKGTWMVVPRAGSWFCSIQLLSPFLLRLFCFPVSIGNLNSPQHLTVLLKNKDAFEYDSYINKNKTTALSHLD